MRKKAICVIIILTIAVLILAAPVVADYWMSLQEILGDTRLDNRLKYNSPRQIRVETPKRYISKVHIYHGEKSDKGKGTFLTSIDIYPLESWYINNIYVDAVRLNPDGSPSGTIRPSREASKNFDPETGEIYWNVGFGNIDVDDNIDIEIRVYDYRKDMVQKLYVRFAEGEKITAPKESMESNAERGYIYTLHDLIADPNLFIVLLKWYTLDEIKLRFKY